MWAWELSHSKNRFTLGKSVKVSYNTVCSDNEVTDVRPLGDLYQLRLCYVYTHYYYYDWLSGTVNEVIVVLSMLIIGRRKVPWWQKGWQTGVFLDIQVIAKLIHVSVMGPCVVGGNVDNIKNIMSQRILENVWNLFLRALSATIQAQGRSLNSWYNIVQCK